MRIRFAALLVGLMAFSELAAQEARPNSAWNVMIGGGAIFFPQYPGSDEHRVFPFPMTQVSWRNRVFLGPSTTGMGLGLGAYVIRTPRLGLAAEVGFLENRPASRADALAGMDDRDLVATGSVSLSYTVGAFEASLSTTQGMNDNAGLLGAARLSFTQPVGERLIVTAGVGATFANARQMRWDFGVSRAEATRRQALIAAGDDRLEPNDGRAYEPDAGLRHLSSSLSLAYMLSPRWAVLGFGGVDRLSAEAAASPLVRRRDQVTGGVGLGYRF